MCLCLRFSLCLHVLVCCVAGGRGELMLTATYLIILATVLANGGACTYFLERLGLRGQPLAEIVGSPGGLPIK